MIKMIPVGLLLLVVGCSPINVFQRDEDSITNLHDIRSDFVADMSRVAGLDDPEELSSSDFPLGDLSYDEFEASLGFIDAAIFHEEVKEDIEEEADDE